MKKKLIFDKLMVEFVEQKTVYGLEMNSDNGEWLDEMEPDCLFLKTIYLNIYGVPVIINENLEDAYYEGDTSKFNKIGRLMGYYIPFEEILEAGGNPVDICDDVTADLSFVTTNIQDYNKENETLDFPNIFYIDELEVDEQYRNNGFGSKVLQELPYLLNYHKGIVVDVIAYYPASTQPNEITSTPYEEALMRQAVYKMNEYYGDESVASQRGKDKIVALPREYSKKEIDEIIEIEKNTPSYPEEFKNAGLFSFYERNGFEEYKQTRLLIKEL